MGRFSRGVIADGGAAALEFALVVPVLAVLVFGMIDYGFFFTDSLGARDGARVAARQGSVDDFSAACPTGYIGFGDPKLARLACSAIDETGAIGGDTYVRAIMPQGWAVDNDLVVCVAVVENGLTGFTPMPNNSTARAKLQVRIERTPGPPDNTPVTGTAQRSTASAPSDLWTSWCD